MSWKAPDARNAEGLEICAKVISPKSRADIRVDDVDDWREIICH
jgi:hypothetical protein